MISSSLLSIGYVLIVHFSAHSIPLTSGCEQLVSLSTTTIRFLFIICLEFPNFSHGPNHVFCSSPLSWAQGLWWYRSADKDYLFRIVCGMSWSSSLVYIDIHEANVGSPSFQLSKNEFSWLLSLFVPVCLSLLGRCCYLVCTCLFTLGWLMFSR